MQIQVGAITFDCVTLTFLGEMRFFCVSPHCEGTVSLRLMDVLIRATLFWLERRAFSSDSSSQHKPLISP